MNALDRLRMLCVADVMTRNVVTLSSRQSMLEVCASSSSMTSWRLR